MSRAEGADDGERTIRTTEERTGDEEISNPKLVAMLMDEYTAKELRSVAKGAGARRKRGDSKKQTAWRIVQQNREAALEAVGAGAVQAEE